MNRGNAKQTVFHDATDYDAFVRLMVEASRRIDMRILAGCVMPNHFHLVLWPYEDGDLSRWMHWLLSAHVQRHRRRYETVGRIWQGRFKAPVVQEDGHLLTVMRYVERNPVRARLVGSAADWPWSSFRWRNENRHDLCFPSPVTLPGRWIDFVDQALTADELKEVRTSLHRGRPYGDPAWVQGTAERLGLLGTLRPVGRPRIKREK